MVARSWCIRIRQGVPPGTRQLDAVREEQSEGGVVRRETAGGEKWWSVGWAQEVERLGGNFGPDALARKHFEKNGMGDSTVDDMGFADAASERIQAGMDLGQHPFADRALLHHPLHVFA